MSSNILAIRFSALGDVAMTLPVLYSAARAHPNHMFYVLTSKSFADLFTNQLPNMEPIGVDLEEYRGVSGLMRLARKTRTSYAIDAVADLHDVMRSQVLRTYFMIGGKRVAYIRKERSTKKAIIKRKAPLAPVKHSIDRYRDVFSQLGLEAEMSFTSYFESQPRPLEQLKSLSFNTGKTNLGIAPFATYAEKMYPIDRMEEAVKAISERDNTHIYLFGGGSKEKDKLEEWEAKYSNVTSVVGKLSLKHELLLISFLSVLVSMDSANMHLASLVNTPVLSIWGATHPYLGFYGFKQSPRDAVQLSDLDCRPCSVFGNVPCWRGDHACMNGIPAQAVIDRIEMMLQEYDRPSSR